MNWIEHANSKNTSVCEHVVPVNFLLLDGFSALSLSSAIEVLRVANNIFEHEHFPWKRISEAGCQVLNSQNLSVEPHGSLKEEIDGGIIMACASVDIRSASTPKILYWIRRQFIFGSRVGALCTATFTLAKAGLLKGRRATIHWE